MSAPDDRDVEAVRSVKRANQIRRRPRRWTEAQKEQLRRDYPDKPTEEVAESIGVTINQLRQQARRLGVTKAPGALIAEAQQKAVLEKARVLGG